MPVVKTWICVRVYRPGCGEIFETNGTHEGTAFPYGSNVRYPLDDHRRAYTDEDAKAVADMVNESSWLARAGR